MTKTMNWAQYLNTNAIDEFLSDWGEYHQFSTREFITTGKYTTSFEEWKLTYKQHD